MSLSQTLRQTDRYEAVIGLEVHAQLLTASKIFSPEPAQFGGAPNSFVDAISLAHPGTLPVFNRAVLDATIRMGLATQCRINRRSVFARKHYFYPDLPKGYQISQYEDPICEEGYVEIELEGPTPEVRDVKRVGITRIHMEEDAGKSIHDQDPVSSLIDLNRCGVPLMEIVSEPDLRSPREAYLYLTRLRQILRYLGICDGNMEEGSFRCDANVSVRPAGSTGLGTKTELKNMNSFRNVERALEHELGRQIRELESGRRIVQQTLLWDAGAQVTRPMRSKESAHDYRYFPDPDLLEVVVSDDVIAGLEGQIPEMPDVRCRRFVDEYGLPRYDAEVLTEERGMADYFESALEALGRLRGKLDAQETKAVSNVIMTDVLRELNARRVDLEAFPIEAQRLAGLVSMRLDGSISSSAATRIFELMLDESAAPDELARAHGLIQVSDAGALEPFVDDVLAANTRQVEQYLAGKEGLIGYFIGQVMRMFPGAPDPQLVRTLVSEKLDRIRQGR